MMHHIRRFSYSNIIANIIFLDAPVDTGFSYSKSSQGSKMGDIESAQNSYEFLRKWLIEEHPEFQSNPLYIGGDSYSGKIIPIIVQDLINDIEAGKYPFLNFKGYLIGNPVTDGQLENNAEVLFAHGLGLISYELYESMKENCKGNNYVNLDLTNVNCSKDREVYEKCISGINVLQILEPFCPFIASQKQKQMFGYRRSPSKMREFFAVEPLSPRCRSYGYLLSQYWANDDRVRKALHIRKGTVENWIRCNYDLPYEYEVKSSIGYHRNLSTKGYRSLIYSGDHDMWVSHISTEAWIRSLDLSIANDWRPWLVSGQIAGYTRTYSNGMTYATVKGGGHTAPEYRPEECFAMFERWISHNPL
ncbi:Peptidase S10 [Macleaya cordata]|uniref:Peptidase S10 n=1 Tax=Macleaya cordata TaxID=56857 RepID=A0A200QDU2_MACCD|nr:Peptidase S10 [Macleaya cordata]